MPYQLERGGPQRLIEKYLNADRPTMGETLETLRATTSPDWVNDLLPGLWRDPGFTSEIRESSAEHVLGDWFGIGRSDGDHVGTGYWIGYQGDVEGIVRNSLIWALELALGLERGEHPDRRRDAGPPDKIELFWTCSSPWFEAWVVRRPIGPAPNEAEGVGRSRGLVTVHFLTPSHAGANVSETPLATATDAFAGPDRKPLACPVPSLEIDYEQLDQPWEHHHLMGGRRPRVSAGQREYAMWVVSHARHELIVENPDERGDIVERTATTGPRAFADWKIPQLSIYRGRGDIVIVSPSLRSGGIAHDGEVSPEDAESFSATGSPEEA